MNIQQSLKTSANKLNQKNIPFPDLDVEVLLLEALNRTGVHSLECKESEHKKTKIAYRLKPELQKNKSWLYLNNKYILNKKEEELFNNFINQRLKHKPVAYIVNRKEFYGYDFYVDENVLIPRPETELIVEEVLKILAGVHSLECKNSDTDKINSYRLKPELQKFNLIDIGTGSGCIIISILNELAKNKNGKIIYNAYANDISEKAIKLAKINSKKYNLNKKIKFIKNDFEKFLNSDKEDIYTSNKIIITANLPYIKNDDYKNLSTDIKKYEPKIALTAGKDGLDYIKKLVNLISKIQLKPNQQIYLFFEADPDQMNEIIAISRKKITNIGIEIIKDLSGRERIIKLRISLLLSSRNERSD